MILFIVCTILILIAFILYCCIHNTTSYDNEVDDIEQEKFIKEYPYE